MIRTKFRLSQQKVVVVPKVKINLVIIVIVGIDIVINVDYKGYHGGNKTHVAESI